MAPDPKCAALAAAKARKGWSYAQIANGIGSTEQRVIDVVTGQSKATDAEFNALAQVLGITNVPHTGVHSTA